MILFIATIGSIIAALGTVPYIIETIKGKTKPRIVSWLTWTLITSIATAGSFADGQIGGAIFSFMGVLATGSVVLAGLRYGDRSFNLLDIICMCGVIIGILLWQIFNNPAFAVWAAIIIDFVGLLPTIKHAWAAPHEETLSTYIFVAAGGILTVGATLFGGNSSVTAIGYPVYAALSMGSVAVIVAASNHKKQQQIT